MKTFSIAKKIYVGLSILLAGYVLSMVQSYWSGQTLRSELASINDSFLPNALASQVARFDFDAAMQMFQDAGMMGDPGLVAGADERLASLLAGLKSIGERRRAAGDESGEVDPLIDALNRVRPKMNALYSKMADGDFSPELAEEAASLNEIASTIVEDLANLQERSKRSIAEEFEIIETVSAEQRNASLLIFLVCALAGCAFSFVVVRKTILGPINDILSRLGMSGDELWAAASTVRTASDQLAEGSSRQASSLEETTASMSEMAARSQENAKDAQQCNGFIRRSSSKVSEGVASMGEMSEAIARIEAASKETAKIIHTIDEIAFQTNILALNAAVEAARAGDAGSGFAVVAEEVRALALRSAKAASSTATLLDDMQKNVRSTSTVSAKVSQNFDEIASSVQEVKANIERIADSSREQSEGISQVNAAIGEVDRVVQEHAATAEETASTSHTLSSETERLNALLGELELIANGRKSDRRRMMPAASKRSGSTRPKQTPQEDPFADFDRSRRSGDVELFN